MVGGSGRIDAFEKAFSVQADEFGQLLLQYFLAGDFLVRSIPVSTSLTDFSPTVETLAVAQVQIALAEMAMRFQNVDAAEEWFTQALSNEATKPRAEAGLGTVFGYRAAESVLSLEHESSVFTISAQDIIANASRALEWQQ